jgi:hypothetical protein
MLARGTPEVIPAYRSLLINAQGAVYGKCIAANYQNAHKDMCAKEFMMLKDCYLVGVIWLLTTSGYANNSQKAAGKKA